MIQLRYLIDVQLDKGSREKQSNGSILVTYEKVDDYKVQLQELTDEVSAAIYGADVERMYRLTSPNNSLERFLFSKVNNTSDNISMYSLLINSVRYKVKVVRRHWIDVEIL